MRKKLKMIKWAGIAVLVVVGAGVIFYNVALTREAKEAIKHAGSDMNQSYKKVKTVISDITGIVMEEDVENLANRQATISEWESLGYSAGGIDVSAA